jgi:ethanolamine permease
VPRGLVWAQLTLIGLVVLTWLFACGALDSQEIAATRLADGTEVPVDYPLAKVVRSVPLGRSPVLAYGFGAIALFGMIASYHGAVYATSRQTFALGRAGYLPALLGKVHADRRTPVPALATTSLVTAGFVVASFWFREAINVAILASALTALVWYVLAMACLLVLRRREPGLFRSYRAPLARLLPGAVIVLALLAVVLYAGLNVNVIPLTALLYAGGLAYYCFRAHGHIQRAAPEELAARQPAGREESRERPPTP